MEIQLGSRTVDLTRNPIRLSGQIIIESVPTLAIKGPLESRNYKVNNQINTLAPIKIPHNCQMLPNNKSP